MPRPCLGLTEKLIHFFDFYVQAVFAIDMEYVCKERVNYDAPVNDTRNLDVVETLDTAWIFFAFEYNFWTASGDPCVWSMYLDFDIVTKVSWFKLTIILATF
jgi:hypothetical protein